MHTHQHNHSKAARRVTLVGAVINLLLSVVKIIVGFWGHSAALVADGIHSLSDLASDAIVIVAARHGQQPADEEHPYGHARIETVATVILGSMLTLVALGIAWDATDRMLDQAHLRVPGMLVIIVAAISLASKEWLYQYTMRVARRIRSRLLEANAWHHRSDAISSLIVLLGVAGAMAGLPILDALAAFVVALMIGQIAWKLISTSIKELVDTAADEETQLEIKQLINNTEGVVSLHMLRTRHMGSDVLVDAHIQVSPRISVSEGHYIAEIVRHKLILALDDVADVTIHIDPEDDEDEADYQPLPLRQELQAQLAACCADMAVRLDLNNILLHYLDGKVEAELLLPLPEAGLDEARKIQARFDKLAMEHEMFSSIKTRFH